MCDDFDNIETITSIIDKNKQNDLSNVWENKLYFYSNLKQIQRWIVLFKIKFIIFRKGWSTDTSI